MKNFSGYPESTFKVPAFSHRPWTNRQHAGEASLSLPVCSYSFETLGIVVEKKEMAGNMGPFPRRHVWEDV